MTRHFLAAVAGIVLGGCSLSSGLDAEIETSIKYDEVECAALIAKRDALAASYGVSRDAERDAVMNKRRQALGPAAAFIPDLRSGRTKEVERAKGQIQAMNSSLRRRRC